MNNEQGKQTNYNSLKAFFQAGNRVTKDQIVKVFGLSGEREARELISEIAKDLPIVALSSKAGYRMALDPTNPNDVAEVLATLKDHESRRKKLIRRDWQLKQFLKRARRIERELKRTKAPK